MRRLTAFALATGTLACAAGPPEPAPLDTRNEQCTHCRMAVSDPRFAAQVGAPGELARFFDDPGCLAAWLKEHQTLPAGAVAWVADHRTKAWVPASDAVYTKVPRLETPMSSHVIAHADAASRDRDPDARGGAPLPVGELFGPTGPPRGGRPR
jgi:copper chaperone NosL